jgi:DNA-directed RNA polymerase subunit RPC12/RpoP
MHNYIKFLSFTDLTKKHQCMECGEETERGVNINRQITYYFLCQHCIQKLLEQLLRTGKPEVFDLIDLISNVGTCDLCPQSPRCMLSVSFPYIKKQIDLDAYSFIDDETRFLLVLCSEHIQPFLTVSAFLTYIRGDGGK